MTSRRRLGVAAAVAAIALVAACGDDGEAAGSSYGPDREIVVEDATVVEPAGANSAVYLTLRNEGPDADRLVEVRSTVADRTELHETRAGDDGLMYMHAVDAVELPVDATVRLEPGGLHVMLFGVADLDVGATTTVELVFEHGASLTIDATVRTHADLLG